MNWLGEMREDVTIGGVLMSFLWHNKMCWMTPIVTVLVLKGLLIGFGSAAVFDRSSTRCYRIGYKILSRGGVR